MPPGPSFATFDVLTTDGGQNTSKVGRGGASRPVASTRGLAAADAGATAMIDISDGLIADASHIARASGVTLALDDVPVADGATQGDALYGGDDYELLCTAPPECVARRLDPHR